MKNYPSDKEQKAFYDVDTHLRVRNDRLIGIENYIINLLKQYSNIKTVLEVGCGVGITSRFMHTSGLKVVGIDISEKHIEMCKKLAPGAAFICDNFIRVDLKEQVFDLITFFDILEHIPKPHHAKVFEHVKKASHPETKIAIIIPEPEQQTICWRATPELLQPVDESIYPEDINPLFEQYNLKVIEYEESGKYVKYLLEY